MSLRPLFEERLGQPSSELLQLDLGPGLDSLNCHKQKYHKTNAPRNIDPSWASPQFCQPIGQAVGSFRRGPSFARTPLSPGPAPGRLQPGTAALAGPERGRESYRAGAWPGMPRSHLQARGQKSKGLEQRCQHMPAVFAGGIDAFGS